MKETKTAEQWLHELPEQHQKTMTKFKKGDRVKVITGGSAGRVGTVMEDSSSPWIKFDDHRPSVCNILPDHIMGSKKGHMDYFSENDLTLVDQPLSTTPDKVLQAAKTSPQAKDALKALFPDLFKDEPMKSLLAPGTEIFSGVHIGMGPAFWSNSKHVAGKYLYMDPNTSFATRPNPDGEGTLIEFFGK
jgi:hypothetical protein